MAQREIASSTPARSAVEPRGALSVGKAIAILDAFLNAGEGLTLTEVAERAGISRSTCHRLLSALVQGAYLERNEAAVYRPGMRLFQLGALVDTPSALATLADPEMRRIADISQISAFLSVRDDERAVCIHRVDRGEVILAPYRVGETLPLHVGAAPLVLLASMDDQGVSDYLDGDLMQLTRQTDVDPRRIRTRILRIRREGFAVARTDDIAIGLSAIGAPILDHTGRVVAALSLSGLAAHILPAERKLVELLQASAADIGHQLGSARP